MKLTRAEKRRRKTVKIVSMKLDGVKEPPGGWRSLGYEQLCRYEQNWRSRNSDFYGYSLADVVMTQKAMAMQVDMDKSILEIMTNGQHRSTSQ